MNIQLTRPDLAKFVEEQVRAGHFPSPAHVIEAGLARLMLDADADALDAETLDALEAAEAQAERGESREWKIASGELRERYRGS